MNDRIKKANNIMEIYATLVGRVDRAITVMEYMIERQCFDWFHVIQAAEMLKTALLEAEEAYIESAGEMESHIVVIRPQDGK